VPPAKSPVRQSEPCTRCSQRHLVCNYQPRFLRSRKRRRVDLAEDHGSASPHGIEDKWPASNESSPPITLDAQRNLPEAVADQEPSCLYTGPDVSIEDVVLRTPDINDHLRYFFSNMHIHFPFLGSPFPATEILQTSPLLFWTIIAIACGFRNRALYRSTSYPFSLSSETCQALCLLCLWPFEADDPNDDPVFVYAGMATHLALHIGMHRPQYSREFKQINKTMPTNQLPSSSRLLAWCACIFVEINLASKIAYRAELVITTSCSNS
jgi:hypothetical protein